MTAGAAEIMAPNINPDDLRKIVREELHEGIKQAFDDFFLTLGVDVSSSAEIKKVQADFAHLRGWRESTDMIKAKGFGAAVTTAVAALIGAVFVYFQHRQ